MGELAYGLMIEPLMSIYRTVYGAIPDIFGGEGTRIILFSILLNLVLMPVYAQMERKSRAGRELRQRVAAEEARMKRHFKGRELYYYIRAVHRQFNYRPLSHLFGSADLLVQVLVFATVYQFLSGLESLPGTAFGPLRDLGKPDGLLGGLNLLPFVMTAINLASVFAYMDDRSRRVQGIALALLFLLLLYQSPSALVLYWTMNNLFSLIRTYVQKRLAQRARPWTGLFAALRQQA